MSEFGNWIPILGLLIPTISLAVAILTYLRVSRKYLSKTLHFSMEIKPNEERVLFHVDGVGSFQKLEMTAEGGADAIITLLVDGQVCMRESFRSLRNKASRYLTLFILPSTDPQALGRFGIDMNLERIFFKNLELMITNKHDTASMNVNGTIHYNISEHRFHFLHFGKKPRELTDLSKNLLRP